MELNPMFRLEGRSLDRRELEAYCRGMEKEPGQPDWKREVYAFILQLLRNPPSPVIQQTSGTTGDPRSYVLRPESMEASAKMTLRFFSLSPGSRALLCLPMRYVAGKMMVVRALVGGLDLRLAEPSARPLAGQVVPVDFTAMVPLQVKQTLEYGDPLQKTDVLLIGGGEIHPALRKELQLLPSPELWESFAMTETYSHFALRRINGKESDPGFRALPGVSLDTDQRGCLVVDMPGVTEGKVVTSDMAELMEGGNRFRWLGRYDNVISSGGIKIYPETLEEKIRELVGHDCLLLSEPDPGLGRRLVLLVEDPGGEGNPQGWSELLKDELDPYAVPKRIMGVERIPRNASFKPDRIEAARQYLQSHP